MKMARLQAMLVATLLFCGQALAQTVIVNETFDSYATDNDMLAKWPMVAGATHPDGPANAITGAALNTSFPNVEGKAVQFDGSSTAGYYTINQWNTPFQVSPSATQNVKLSFDMYAPSTGTAGPNYKTTIGLRGASAANLLEIGIHNSNPTPFIPFGFRLVGFGISAADATAAGLTSGGYGAFPLPAGKRSTTDAQVGGGWHHYEVLFTTTSVTLTLDLYGDGLNNQTPAPAPGVGVAGVDASVTITTAMNLTAGFSDLRFGVPSANGSSGTVAGFDNIRLETIAASVPPGNNADFNGDNIVDGKDFLIWQRGFGAAGTLSTGDANNDTLVNDADLAIFKTQFGTDPTPAVGAVAAVPEPTTLALAGIAVLGTLASARRRK